jgi:hypothetical protein
MQRELVQALDSLLWLAIFLVIGGIGSFQLDAPPEEAPWYQYEGALRGL